MVSASPDDYLAFIERHRTDVSDSRDIHGHGGSLHRWICLSAHFSYRFIRWIGSGSWDRHGMVAHILDHLEPWRADDCGHRGPSLHLDQLFDEIIEEEKI